jgi:dolichyl-phosphate-mannose-protein mannosyltransferase
MNFFRKFGELQLLMLQHNAGLTGAHPYASTPINWPFSLTGISFWTENDPQKQIYLVGNLVGWWACVVGLSIYVGILGADLIARRRGMDPIADRKCWLVVSLRVAHMIAAVRNRLWNNTGFFMLVWAVHYLPFFLFSRQLFIHHYLPSHLASAMIAGSVLSFVLSDTINFPISLRGPKTRPQAAQYADVGTKGVATTIIFSLVMFVMFSYMAPLTYGSPGYVFVL